MMLTNALAQLNNEIEIERVTFWQYSRAVARFGEFLGRPAEISDLEPAKINAYLAWLTEKYQSGPCTILNHRAGILRVWGYCADVLELAPQCPTKRIRRPKQPQRIVRAWSLDELDLLLQAAKDMPGQLRCGIPAAKFITARIWVGYDTGLRPIDLRLLRWDSVDLTCGSLIIIQNKTKGMHRSLLGPESLASLRELREYEQERVFPVGKSGAIRWDRMLFRRAAKLGFILVERQGIGTLRKTHATEICRSAGLSAAAESLGHRSGTTIARNHYVDSRLQPGHLPPRPARRA